MQYVRVYAASDGESRFEDRETALSPVDFAPPAAIQNVSAFTPACQVGFLSVQPGWFGDWHPVPRRQFLFYLSGEIEIQVADGEVRRLGPGSVLLAEDTTGIGHTTRVVSSEAVLAAVVQLPD